MEVSKWPLAGRLLLSGWGTEIRNTLVVTHRPSDAQELLQKTPKSTITFRLHCTEFLFSQSMLYSPVECREKKEGSPGLWNVSSFTAEDSFRWVRSHPELGHGWNLLASVADIVSLFDD